ncbi:MAG: hypothetical protein J0L84_13415 [Verrucomicrobia bacterium]|nr:hypothetical protein [Verrucomicrobiota bacterium]
MATALSAAELKSVPVPERTPVELKPYGSLASRASIEPPGMVKSSALARSVLDPQ